MGWRGPRLRPPNRVSNAMPAQKAVLDHSAHLGRTFRRPRKECCAGPSKPARHQRDAGGRSSMGNFGMVLPMPSCNSARKSSPIPEPTKQNQKIMVPLKHRRAPG